MRIELKEGQEVTLVGMGSKNVAPSMDRGEWANKRYFTIGGVLRLTVNANNELSGTDVVSLLEFLKQFSSGQSRNHIDGAIYTILR